MKTFSLKISSPDGSLFDAQATMLTVRGVEGDLAIMADHVPFITAVKKCECKVILPDESVKMGQTQGGLLTVSREGVVLLSSSFAWQA